ncbi:MAG: AraC family transcriptional regulator [Pseudomonadota bacterium]
MSTALAVFHGPFGRAALYRLNRPLAPHAHREGHLIFLVEGQGATVLIDGTPCRVDRETAVAISPWQPHEFRPTDLGTGATFLTLYITPRWFAEMSRGVAPVMRFGASRIQRGAAIDGLCRKVAELMADGHTGDGFPGYLYELTCSCFEDSWSASHRDRRNEWPRVSDFRIRNAMRLMNERITDSCVLDKIARDAGLSRPHFYKLFRQNIGLTPNMYLNTLRLELSIDRLTHSEDPVTSIGIDLGFASQASFTRFFSNNIGIAPTDFRRVSFISA